MKKKKKTANRKNVTQYALKLIRSIDFHSSLLFLVVTLLILLNVFSFQTNIGLKIGDIAPRDIYAYTDLEVPDEVATSKKRKEALENTPNVYLYLSDKRDEIIEKINAISTLVKDYLNKKRSIKEGKRPDMQVQNSLKQSLIDKISVLVPVGEEYFQAMVSFFSEDRNVERLKDFVSYIYTRGLVKNKKLFTLKNNEAILYDSQRKQEFLIRQKPAVLDFSDLKNLIKDFFTTVKLDRKSRRYLADFLFNLFEPNYIFDSQRTKDKQKQAIESVEISYLRKKSGEIIVRKGERVNKIAYRFIEQQNKILKKNITLKRILANTFVLTLLVFLGFWLVALYRKRFARGNAFVFSLIMVINTLGVIVLKGSIFILGLIERSLQFQSFLQAGLIFFAVPYAFPVSLTAVILDWFAALIVAFFLTVIVILVSAGNIKLVLFAIFTSIAVIYFLRQTTRRTSLMLASFMLGLINFVIASIILFYYGYTIDFGFLFSLLFITVLGSIFMGGLVSTFSPLVESLFGIVSDMKLSELSTMDNPLLKQLAMGAPGTYQHSIRVANFAEAAAQRINANALLVKVGAYYHDIGKVKKAEYFIENLRPGEENKHSRLAPKISALILKNHVKDGVEMGEEYGLPEEIIDFIREHHGTKLMTYFYNKALSMADENGENVLEEEYRYPGPKPSSKESAILMMADAIEAASRTLHSPLTPGKIQHLVDRIVQDIIDDGQLSESEITFKELSEVKKSFIENLSAYFHTRIDYPGFDFNKEDENEPEKEKEVQDRADG